MNLFTTNSPAIAAHAYAWAIQARLNQLQVLLSIEENRLAGQASLAASQAHYYSTVLRRLTR